MLIERKVSSPNIIQLSRVSREPQLLAVCSLLPGLPLGWLSPSKTITIIVTRRAQQLTIAVPHYIMARSSRTELPPLFFSFSRSFSFHPIVFGCSISSFRNGIRFWQNNVPSRSTNLQISHHLYALACLNTFFSLLFFFMLYPTCKSSSQTIAKEFWDRRKRPEEIIACNVTVRSSPRTSATRKKGIESRVICIFLPLHLFLYYLIYFSSFIFCREVDFLMTIISHLAEVKLCVYCDY